MKLRLDLQKFPTINTTSVTEILKKKKGTEVNSGSSLNVILCQFCWWIRCVAKTNNVNTGK